MKSDNKLSNALGIEHKEDDKKDLLPFKVKNTNIVGTEKTPPAPLEQKSLDEQNDYILARNNLHNLLNVGNRALGDLAEVCRGTEQPRAFEVMSHMMKTMADTSKDLYEIQEKSRKITEMDRNGGTAQDKNTTNINVEKGVFVGSAADLLKQIEEDEKKSIKTIENIEE